ncbi:hypothetical protein MATL_G00000740 [Megalops atlanticus]|uniref:Autocrine proliferation repressor protein A-like n=1 Tax=Megalops atlanticus TaxID=7932 RepID=A0A9D3TKL6_MEGAT|nr:hypothetical protein MATL_G00000740 [Megalops atlanticus]
MTGERVLAGSVSRRVLPAASRLRAMECAPVLLLLQSALWASSSAAPLHPDPQSALDRYVSAFDPHYSYTVLDHLTRREEEFTSYVLNMTSLKWLNESVVDRAVWWHYVRVTVPHHITPGLEDSAFLFIDGGSNRAAPPTYPSLLQALIGAFAVSAGTVSACVSQIPNQPLSFLQDVAGKRTRSEDSLMAYTWWHFLNNHTDEPDWLLLFPMTKAAVRAMDTVSDFVLKISAGQRHIDRFTVSGGSKRGWTAWLAAAVDPRVVSFAPIVLDLLNMTPSLHHHFRAYGGWSFAFQSYYELNITKLLDSSQMGLMTKLIDPLAYSRRYRAKPKLVISTVGDEFFLPDNSHYYYQQLQGEKMLRIVPNAEHLCVGHWMSVLLSAQSFYLSTMLGHRRPTMHWNMTQSAESGAIYLYTDVPPLSVVSYHTDTADPTRRDFRWIVAVPGHPDILLFRPTLWRPSPVTSPSPGVYMKQLPVPRVGWRAFFIEATFPGPMGTVQTFTTEVNIIPDVFPFPECKAQKCHGTLV